MGEVRKPILYPMPLTYDGLSETDSFTIQSQGILQADVDGQTQPEFLKLARKTEKVFESTSLVTCKLGDYFFGGKECRYKDGTKVSTSALTTNSKPIINATKFNLTGDGPVYLWIYKDSVSGDGRIGKIKEIDLSATSWVTFTSTYKTGLEQSDYYPTYNLSDTFLFIGHGKKISKLEASGVITSLITFNANVISITKKGYWYAVYLDNGKKARWDGASNIPESMEDLEDKNVRFVKQMGSFDYVAGGSSYQNSVFYRSQQSFQDPDYMVTVISKALNVLKFGVDSESKGSDFTMAMYRKKIYIPVKEATNQYSIYCYGNTNKGFPPLYNRAFTLNNDAKTFQKIGLLETDGTYLYIGNYDGSKYYVDKVNLDPTSTALYQSQGTWYSAIFDMGKPTSDKEIVEREIKNICTTGQTIDIQISKEVNGVWSSFSSIVVLNGNFIIFPDGIIGQKFILKYILTTNDASKTPYLGQVKFSFKYVNRQ